ncbi:MAG: hypothetical protein Q7R94_02730, partial [bacterium]|nr:hypothetical protein [bacterium]
IMNQRNIWQRIVGTIVTVVVLGGAIYFFTMSKSQQSAPREAIMLDASSAKSTYKAGEEIRVDAHLKNSGEVDTCVSTMGAGNIRTVSFTRDGESVETRSTPVYFITSFDKMLEVSLVPVKPGESLDIMLSSELDDGLQKQALRTTSLDDGRGIAMFYDIETPGDYQLKLVYEYPGPKSSNCAHVFGEETNIAVVTFTVIP